MDQRIERTLSVKFSRPIAFVTSSRGLPKEDEENSDGDEFVAKYLQKAKNIEIEGKIRNSHHL